MAAHVRALDRRKFLGGTDFAPVLGVSPWATSVDVWQEKTGRAVRNESDLKRARMLKRGKRLEPFIREMTLQKLRDDGHDVELLAKNRRYVDHEFPFLSVEIDFEVRLDGEHINVDAKSVNTHARKAWGEIGTEEIPIYYAAQFMGGLMVAPGERKRCLAAALRSFDDVDLYWTVRDDETIAAMRPRLVEFWHQHVVADVPPEPTTIADVRALFPRAGGSIEATDEQLAALARLKQISADKKALEGEEERLRFEIARFMGPHALLTQGVRDLITWENQEIKRFDVQRFRAEHGDWAAMYMKTETTRVMRGAARR
jgi:predicted phage-related endonuclease